MSKKRRSVSSKVINPDDESSVFSIDTKINNKSETLSQDSDKITAVSQESMIEKETLETINPEIRIVQNENIIPNQISESLDYSKPEKIKRKHLFSDFNERFVKRKEEIRQYIEREKASIDQLMDRYQYPYMKYSHIKSKSKFLINTN